MARIKLTTIINAPAIVCFDLARSIDLHLNSMKDTGERAIAGITHGTISIGETVTWRARHLGLMLQMTSQITEMRYATSFTDEQVKGPFRYLKHLHTFQQEDGHTIMTDHFEFASPLGWLGQAMDELVMERYLTALLIRRNREIRYAAEKTQSHAELVSAPHHPSPCK